MVDAPSTTPTEEEMRQMYQYLESTMTSGLTLNGVTPEGPLPYHQCQQQQLSEIPAAMVDGEAEQLNDYENGMCNELGDVFNMFVNLDDESSTSTNTTITSVDGLDPNTKVQLPRNLSTSNIMFSDGISPGNILGYPTMSPATMSWLQSLASSGSTESLPGLISPAGIAYAPGASVDNVMETTAPASATNNNALSRTPSCDMIDWKAYNELEAKTQRDGAKWRVIPQYGPHADSSCVVQEKTDKKVDEVESGERNHFITRQLKTIKSTVVSLVGAALSTSDATTPPPITAMDAGIDTTTTTKQQPFYSFTSDHLSIEENNKRKAIISPEYVQYGTNGTTVSHHPESFKNEPILHVSKVPNGIGRRPVKRLLHQEDSSGLSSPVEVRENSIHAMEINVDSTDVRCKCTGKCRNARCACVKAGLICGVHCKCIGCANPLLPMEKAGILVAKVVEDVCLMQFLSKIKDMEELLDSSVSYDCACTFKQKVQVKETVEHGFTCPTCHTHFTYSWCNHRLCNDQKKPRKHCAKCRRCGDHRNEHCDECNHCYFAGVAHSFKCSCTSGGSGGGVMVTGGSSGVRSSRNVIPNSSISVPLSCDETPGKTTSTQPATVEILTQASQPETMVQGLSNTEKDKDDSCPVQ